MATIASGCPTSAQDLHTQWTQGKAELREDGQKGRAAGQWVNVGQTERLLSLLGGTGLAAFGLCRRSYGGLALAALGGSLIYRGVTGHCPLFGVLGVSTA